MKLSKKAFEMPINIVVMLIIGMVLFGLGMGLFSQISSSGQEQISDLNDRVKTNIASIECQGNDWICVPSYTLGDGDQGLFEVFVVNRGDSTADFSLNFALTSDNGIGAGNFIHKDSCGVVRIEYLSDPISIQSGQGASIPFVVSTGRVTQTPCSFITTVELTGGDSSGEKASVIIKVE